MLRKLYIVDTRGVRIRVEGPECPAWILLATSRATRKLTGSDTAPEAEEFGHARYLVFISRELDDATAF